MRGASLAPGPTRRGRPRAARERVPGEHRALFARRVQPRAAPPPPRYSPSFLLTIVDAVAKLHGGVLRLLDNHPGLLAQMVLPVTAAPPGR